MCNRYIIILSIFLLLCSAEGQPRDHAVLTFFAGPVEIIDDSGKKAAEPEAGLKIPSGAIVKTGKNSLCWITIGNTQYTIPENSRMRISELSGNYSQSDNSFSSLKKLHHSAVNSYRTVVVAVRAEKMNRGSTLIDDRSVGVIQGSSADILCSYMENQFRLKDYHSVIKIHKENSSTIRKDHLKINFIAAMAHLNLCHYKEAVEVFKGIYAVSKADRLKYDSLYFCGFSYYAMNAYSDSIEHLSRYIESGSKKFIADAFYLRGLNYLRLEKRDLALRDFRTVIDLYSTHSIAGDAKREYQRLQ